MEPVLYDSLSASPEDVERQLHRAVAAIICQERHINNRRPCPDCVKLVAPLVPPLAGALLIAGYRPPNDYHLAGAAVYHLIEHVFPEVKKERGKKP